MRGEQEEANLRLIEQVFAQVLVPMDSQTVEQYFSPRFVQHNPGMASGIPALKDGLDRAKGAFPRALFSVKRMMADGDLVMVHSHVIFEPGDAGVAVVNIFRIEKGMIAEHWDVVQPVETKPKNGNGMF